MGVTLETPKAQRPGHARRPEKNASPTRWTTPVMRGLAFAIVVAGTLTSAEAPVSSSPTVPGHIAFVGLVPPDTAAYVYVTDIEGSHFSRLARPRCCGRLTLSRDGHSMAWGSSAGSARLPSHILIQNVAASTTTAIAVPSGEIGSVAFGAGDQKLAFVLIGHGSSGGREIYTVRVDGTHLRRVVGEMWGVGSLAYSQDGHLIAFDAFPSRGIPGQQIFVVHDDGTHLTRVTPQGMSGGAPAFDPRGRRIAFESGGGIFVMDTAGSRLTRLTDLAGIGGSDREPAFSLDGRYVAFVSVREFPKVAGSQIYVMHADGTVIKRIAGASFAKFPTFIP